MSYCTVFTLPFNRKQPWAEPRPSASNVLSRHHCCLVSSPSCTRTQVSSGTTLERLCVWDSAALAGAGAKGSMLDHAGEEDFNSLIGLLWTFKSLAVAKQHTCLNLWEVLFNYVNEDDLHVLSSHFPSTLSNWQPFTLSWKQLKGHFRKLKWPPEKRNIPRIIRQSKVTRSSPQTPSEGMDSSSDVAVVCVCVGGGGMGGCVWFCNFI